MSNIVHFTVDMTKPNMGLPYDIYHDFEKAWSLAKNDLRMMPSHTEQDGDRAIEKYWKELTGTKCTVDSTGLTIEYNEVRINANK